MIDKTLSPSIPDKFSNLEDSIEGTLYADLATRLIYATDASSYREVPAAVMLPANENDISIVLKFAFENQMPVIPRGAGTSLAGQVVGNGIILDISKHLNKILELNTSENWVIVEPGVVLDELNKFLAPYNLFFGPETSTSNRCVIGGMVGNNSCGSHSLIYGTTRDHLIEIDAILSDGSRATFKNLTREEFFEKCKGDTLESDIYKFLYSRLSNPEIRDEIVLNYPDPKVTRRNTGYALDLLLDTSPFNEKGEDFNISKIFAGSEGTLAIATKIKLNLIPLPPPAKALVCIHFRTRMEALKATLIALEFKPGAVEMMDHNVLELTKSNIEQSKNRYFVKDDPAAILIIEFARDTISEVDELTGSLEKKMREAGYGYHYPVIKGSDIQKVWNLRKAGLGVLSGMKGDAKSVSFIEDTSVRVDLLPAYIDEIEQVLGKYGKNVVYHAHVGSGELHMRPVLNLKDPVDVELYYKIGKDVAQVVKKYRGSLSGEHGDGRVRGEFIPIVLGEKNYSLLVELKKKFDPLNILNPGKITATPPMTTFLRYTPGVPVRKIETLFDFDLWGGVLRFAEQCNGSGDCRKSAIIGGTMCPSYMATRDEHNTTRARANLLREFLTQSEKDNPFNHKELYDILDLCLSCKGCKSECPSNVDMATLKAEFLQHWYDANGVPLRSRIVAEIIKINRIGSHFPGLYNKLLQNRVFSWLIKTVAGFTFERELPPLHQITFQKWTGKHPELFNRVTTYKKRIYLFVDEFTQYTDVKTGIATVRLLAGLGYKVDLVKHNESSRTYISKGLIRKAKKIARKNIEIFSKLVSKDRPLLGIEPSAILTFRDEYPSLAGKDLAPEAIRISKSVYMIDEFIASEADTGSIKSKQFTDTPKEILLHGHCQQKAVSSTAPTIKMLSLPSGYIVKEIPSGCCGMAGSFGYEKEHYELSMKVGELVLFPEVRKAPENCLIAAPGTSCRHHINHATGRSAKHPVEILFEALKP